jgi:hypothetical protein
MFLVNKYHNVSNVQLTYNKKYNFYNIIYDASYIKLIGLSIKINYKELYIYNYKYYIYIDDVNTLNILTNIDNCIRNTIPNFKLFYKHNNKIYIICKKYIDKKMKLNSNILNIIIYKIKYSNKNNSYIPIINIV